MAHLKKPYEGHQSLKNFVGMVDSIVLYRPNSSEFKSQLSLKKKLSSENLKIATEPCETKIALDLKDEAQVGLGQVNLTWKDTVLKKSEKRYGNNPFART